MQKIDKQTEKKDFETLFSEIKTDLASYLNKRLTIIKLKTYEKGSISGSYIVFGAIVLMMSFSIFLLILLCVGFFLGELLNSSAAGFGILVFATLMILIIFIANGKRIRRVITNSIVSLIKDIEKDGE